MAGISSSKTNQPDYERGALVLQIVFAALKVALVLGAFFKLTEKPQGEKRSLFLPILFLAIAVGVEGLDLYTKQDDAQTQARRFARLFSPFGDVTVHVDYLKTIPLDGDPMAAYFQRLEKKYGLPKLDLDRLKDPVEPTGKLLPDREKEPEAYALFTGTFHSRLSIYRKPLPISKSPDRLTEIEQKELNERDQHDDFSFLIESFNGKVDAEQSAWAGERTKTNVTMVYGNLARRHFRFDIRGVGITDGELTKKRGEYSVGEDILSVDELAGAQLMLEVCPELDVDDSTETKRNHKLDVAQSINVRNLLIGFSNDPRSLLFGLGVKPQLIRKIAVRQLWTGPEGSAFDRNQSSCTYYFYTFPSEKDKFEGVFWQHGTNF